MLSFEQVNYVYLHGLNIFIFLRINITPIIHACRLTRKEYKYVNWHLYEDDISILEFAELGITSLS